MRGVSVAPVADRLMASVMADPNSGCWLWTGRVKNNGYATMGVKTGAIWKTMHAHRISYEIFAGPIPAGMDLDHKCRVRCCVNPAHLEPVSRSENLRRSPLMNRMGQKIACPKGHFYSGTNNRGGRICHKCQAADAKSYRERKTA
jgi:hypothetical protein